jgi:hypothetical protein
MEGERSPAKRRTPWTLIVFGVLGLYVIVVALLNSDRVKVDFLFFSTQTRLLISASGSRPASSSIAGVRAGRAPTSGQRSRPASTSTPSAMRSGGS